MSVSVLFQAVHATVLDGFTLAMFETSCLSASFIAAFFSLAVRTIYLLFVVVNVHVNLARCVTVF